MYTIKKGKRKRNEKCCTLFKSENNFSNENLFYFLLHCIEKRVICCSLVHKFVRKMSSSFKGIIAHLYIPAYNIPHDTLNASNDMKENFIRKLREFYQSNKKKNSPTKKEEKEDAFLHIIKIEIVC